MAEELRVVFNAQQQDGRYRNRVALLDRTTEPPTRTVVEWTEVEERPVRSVLVEAANRLAAVGDGNGT
jgi:hypothetical protein